MKRRQLLAALGTGLAATAGCITTGSTAPDTTTRTPTTTTTTKTPTATDTDTETTTTTERDPLDLPRDRVHAIDENVNHDSVLVKTTYISVVNEVKYNNPEKGSIETWNPGQGYMLAFAKFWAENLSDDKKDYPHWESFQLVTPASVEKPVVETPDGTSVEEIRSGEHTPVVTWPESSGIRTNYDRGWTGVYTIQDADYTNVAVKWNRPDSEPVYWRAQE